ncbi:MAG TPA: CAP domain-containing protein [Polyangiales bacterium]|nr:CAP domain-containing protein [Polyangiales bacterium]
MAARGQWWLVGVVAGCASAEPAPAFFAGLDARVILSDAATPGEAAVRDAAGMDAAAEPGRLDGFLAAHNGARARLDLPPLAWSSEVALVAQAYADQLAAGCLDSLVHSDRSARNGWGENLASYGTTGLGPNGSAEGTVELWESELGCYSYGPFESGTNATCSAACERYGGCGHYTQLVWRSTQRVGCGVADCREGAWRKSYWVCNYDPAGNVRGQLPY